jgi:molecular chaperone GrpE
MQIEHKEPGRRAWQQASVPDGDPDQGANMCEIDRQEEERLEPVGQDPDDTGLWPVPVLPDPTPDSPTQLDAAAHETRWVEESTQPPRAQDLGDSQSPPLTPDSTPRILAAINQLSSLVVERLGSLQTLFDREIRAEATRERIVDRLHAELQEYKHDLLLRVQRPIFLDLIQLHDDLGKMIDVLPADDPDRTAASRSTLESIRTALEDILYRQGVEPFLNEESFFDPRRQRAVKTVATEDAESNKRVAARLRPGFQSGDKLIRPELVSVYTLKQPGA